MNNKTALFITGAVCLTLCIVPEQSAYAGAATGGATEVTQLLNNAQLAMQSVKQEMEYALQMEQYYTQLKQLAPSELVGFMQTANELNQSIADLQVFSSRAADAFGALQNIKTLADQRLYEYRTSGLEWDAYLNRERSERQKSHDQLQVLRDHEIHAIKRAERTWNDLAQHAEDAQATEGTHAAMQVMNGQMNALIAMLNEIRVHDTLVAQYKTEHYSRELAKEEWADYEREHRQEQMQAGADQTTAIIESLRAQAGIE